MDPEFLLNGILDELEGAIEGMAKSDSVQEKLEYSQIIRNLSMSMGQFLNMAADFMDLEEEI